MDQAKKRPDTPRFQVGDKVRVKSGVTVPEFEDIPLGGWAGTIKQVATSVDPVIEIEWDQRTLAGMHPVYRKRCERDDCEIKTMYLGEEDVELDDGTPFLMEQPTQIVTRPLSKDDEDDRIRAVFGLTHDDPLPSVERKTLLTYYRYLSEHLKFPFKGTWERETGSFSMKSSPITVTGLVNPREYDLDEFYGLICDGRDSKGDIQFPLSELEVKKNDRNHTIVSDYSTWFVNFR
jgi:Calcium binding